MRAKLRAVKTELILLIMTAVFLFGLTGLARRDRMAADTAAVSAVTEENLPPEQVEKQMKTDPAFAETVKEIKANINNRS